MKDTFNTTRAVQAIAPAVKSAGADGATIDLKGFGSALFAVNTAAITGDGDFSAKVQEAVTGSGDWEDADAEVVLGTFPATFAASSSYSVGYVGGKRFVRLVLTKEGGTSIALGAVAILGHPALAPVA